MCPFRKQDKIKHDDMANGSEQSAQSEVSALFRNVSSTFNELKKRRFLQTVCYAVRYRGVKLSKRSILCFYVRMKLQYRIHSYGTGKLYR